jgi:hypothetical protein
MQARHERLAQQYKILPWPELAAVCVPRKLQVKSRCGRLGRTARLMRKQNPDCSIGRSALQSLGGAGSLFSVKSGGTKIRDTGDDQIRPATAQDSVLVHQHLKSKAPKFRKPLLYTAIIFVIARHKIDA